MIGVVSAGDASVDATNHSEDVDVETGDADSANDFAAFVGLTNGSTTALNAADDVLNNNAANVFVGDNSKSSPSPQTRRRVTRWPVRSLVW